MKPGNGSGTIVATHVHEPSAPDRSLAFLRRARSELRPLRRAYLWKDRVQICDINRDAFEVIGLGYPDAEVLPLLQEINASYDPATIHQPPTTDPKELTLSRRHPWAEDRVM
jgi:hypothetical protein